MKKKTRNNINFYLGDNIEFMKTKPDNFYDLAIVDPPYFDGPSKLGYYGASITKVGVKRKGYKCNHWDIPDKKYFDQLFRVSKHQIIWGCNYYAKLIPAVGRIIWDKVNENSTFSDCELASCSLHDSVRLYRYMWNGFMQGSTIDGTKMQGNKKLNEIRIHPTQKPVRLYRWLLLKYAKEGNKILDTHGGSFTNAIACDMEGFELDIIEIDKEYFDNGLKAFDKYKSQLNLF